MFFRRSLRNVSGRNVLGRRQRPHSSSTSASNTVPASIHATRTQSEIQSLIQERVKERDSWTDGQPTIRGLLKFLTKMNFDFQPPSREELDREFPLLNLQWETVQDPNKDMIQLTWLGHASVLIQFNGWNILADPIFSDRCSAVQFAGPKRYRPPPCGLDELVEKVSIDLVLISHNHYDHLDFNTVQFLAQNTDAAFVVPLGLRQWFQRHVSKSITTYEQDWHETTKLDHPDGQSPSLSITAVPMRHWTNRTGDRDKTLWCGFALQSSKSVKVLFPGDTAWFDGLEAIGQEYGPFHVAAIPIGAYEPREFMKFSHINVDEAVRMKDAVRANYAVPIHWGTFPMTIEPTFEPRDRLIELMKDREDRDRFQPWLIGETKLFGTSDDGT